MRFSRGVGGPLEKWPKVWSHSVAVTGDVLTKGIRVILWTLAGLAAAILPFVGPAIGFGMGPDPAFTITSGRISRHLIPDLVVIGGALLMLDSSSAAARSRWGGLAAILAGGGVAVGPHVLGWNLSANSSRGSPITR
ncbi:MAG TPA: hypothetical protein VE569_01470 [Acidimicrobiia bacterium]|nr:hypothetical protein [Acidimicrobiia bacterium]